MMRHQKTIVLVFTILVLLVSACTLQPGSSPTAGATVDPTTPPERAAGETASPEQPTSVPVNDLANTEWTLVSMGPTGSETPVLAGSQITLIFEDQNRASGTAGCNSYGGEYRIENGSLVFGDVFSTLMACLDKDVMDQEAAYLEALQSTGAYTLSGDTLAVVYNGGQNTLNYTRGITPPEETPIETGLTETAATPTQAATAPANPSAAPPQVVNPTAPSQDVYLDDRSTPTGLIYSYFNAVSRGEYLRAYSYWRDPSTQGDFEDFAAGYADTVSVEVTLGGIGGDAGAGQMYYSVPALLETSKTSGQTETYAACYTLHISQPAAQEPPFGGLRIDRGSAKLVSGSPEAALESACEDLGLPVGNPISPAPTTDPSDISRDNYLDDRSTPVSVLSSLFNAVNRKEYARAYSYWEDAAGSEEVPPYDQFQAGYANTESVELLTGEVTSDAGAGQVYYQVPVVLTASTTGGQEQTFAGCYQLHLGNPAAQATPPFQPLSVRSAQVEQVDNDANPQDLLEDACRP